MEKNYHNCMEIFFNARIEEDEYEFDCGEPLKLNSVSDFGMFDNGMFYVLADNGVSFLDSDLIYKVVVTGNTDFIQDIGKDFELPFELLILSVDNSE